MIFNPWSGFLKTHGCAGTLRSCTPNSGVGPIEGFARFSAEGMGQAASPAECTGPATPVSSRFSPMVDCQEAFVWGEAMVLSKSGHHHHWRRLLGLGATSGLAALA